MDTDLFRAAIEANDAGRLADAYTDDVLFDAHVPNWHFQVQGRARVLDLLRQWFPHPGTFSAWTTERTASGDLLVRFEWLEDTPAGTITVHQLHLWRTVGGRIAEQVVYCAGRWSEAHVERMRLQAPLVRA